MEPLEPVSLLSGKLNVIRGVRDGRLHMGILGDVSALSVLSSNPASLPTAIGCQLSTHLTEFEVEQLEV